MELGLIAYNVVPFLAIIGLHFWVVFLITRKVQLSIPMLRLGLLTCITLVVWFFVAQGVAVTLALCSQCDVFERAAPLYYRTIGLPFFFCDSESVGLLDALPYLGVPKCYFYSLLLLGTLLFGATIAISIFRRWKITRSRCQ